MTLSSTSPLYIMELAIYLIVAPIIAFLGWRHGRYGFLGYFYLNIFCMVRIVADILSLLSSNQNVTHPTMATAILSSIGLSPLMLALSGFIHEAHVHIVNAKHSTSHASRVKRWLWFAQAQIHGVAILGMVLVITGTIKLVATKQTLTKSETDHDDKLRSAGALMLLSLWVILAQYALYLLNITRGAHVSFGVSNAVSQSLGYIIIAALFVGLRNVYSVVYTFDHTDSQLNPVTGALWVKVVFVVLVPMGAVVGMCVAGWVSRDGISTNTLHQRETSGGNAYKMVGMVCEEVTVSGKEDN